MTVVCLWNCVRGNIQSSGELNAKVKYLTTLCSMCNTSDNCVIHMAGFAC